MLHLRVIMLHVAAGFVTGLDVSNPEVSVHNWWAGNIFESTTRWCVPLFIMISGYFLLNKDESPSTFFKKRLSRVLIPLLFWSLFFSVWTILKYHVVYDDVASAPKALVKAWILGKPYVHLWYLFMIPFLYLITPILRTLFNNLSRHELFVFILFNFALTILNSLATSVFSYLDMNAKLSLFTNNFLMYIGYYCLGGYIAKYDVKVNSILSTIVLITAWSLAIFGKYFLVTGYFHSNNSISTILSSVALFFLIQTFCDRDFKFSSFAKLSFGIYLVHPIFLDILSFAGRSWLLDRMDIYIYIPLASVMVFLLSYAVALSFSKSRYLSRCI